MTAAFLAVLLLNPVLEEPSALRMVAVGTGPEPVEWLLDGRVVATTLDGEAVTVQAGPGEHEVVARSRAAVRWTALVRSEPLGPGMSYVPAWTAEWDGGSVGLPAAARHPDGLVAPTVVGLGTGAGWFLVARRRA
jgi:hypothetical protein